MGNCCSCCKKQGKDPPAETKNGEKSKSDKQPDGMEIPSIADQELQFIDEDPAETKKAETKKQSEVISDPATLSSPLCNYAVMDCTPATVKKEAFDVDERMPKFVSPGAWN